MDPKWIKSNNDKMCIFQILSIRFIFIFFALMCCDLAAMAVDQMQSTAGSYGLL